MSIEKILQTSGLPTMLLFSTTKQKWKTLKQSELRKSESWPKNTQGKTKYKTSHADSENILMDQKKMKK